jgi:hypothetical protein
MDQRELLATTPPTPSGSPDGRARRTLNALQLARRGNQDQAGTEWVQSDMSRSDIRHHQWSEVKEQAYPYNRATNALRTIGSEERIAVPFSNPYSLIFFGLVLVLYASTWSQVAQSSCRHQLSHSSSTAATNIAASLSQREQQRVLVCAIQHGSRVVRRGQGQVLVMVNQGLTDRPLSQIPKPKTRDFAPELEGFIFATEGYSRWLLYGIRPSLKEWRWCIGYPLDKELLCPVTSTCAVGSIWVLMTNSGPFPEVHADLSRIFGMMTLKRPWRAQVPVSPLHLATCHPLIDGRSRQSPGLASFPFHWILCTYGFLRLTLILRYHTYSLGFSCQQLQSNHRLDSLPLLLLGPGTYLPTILDLHQEVGKRYWPDSAQHLYSTFNS